MFYVKHGEEYLSSFELADGGFVYSFVMVRSDAAYFRRRRLAVGIARLFPDGVRVVRTKRTRRPAKK